MAQPARPAPASGPGALSKRTDGGPAQKLMTLPDAQYGEAATYMDLQRSAPLAQSQPTGRSTVTSGSPTGGTPSVIPLNAPTTRPNEPVTTGSRFGAGAGPEVLGLGPGQADLSSARSTLQSVATATNNPEAAALLRMLQTRF